MFAIAKNLLWIILVVVLAGCTASRIEQTGSGAKLDTPLNTPTTTSQRPAEPQRASPAGQQRPLSGHRVMYFVDSGT